MTAIRATIDELRARVTEKGPWFSVPPDARPVECRGCSAMIYMVQQPSGKLMPVDVLVSHAGGIVPHPATADLPAITGKGCSHFGTCPAASQFRRPR